MRSWVLLVGLVVASVPAALAAPATFHLSGAFPLQAAGTPAALGHGDLLVQGPSGELSFVLDGASGTAYRVVHRSFGLDSGDPEMQVRWQDRVERSALDLTGARLVLTQRHDAFVLLGYDTDLRLAPASELLVGVLREPIGVADGPTVPGIELRTDGASADFERILDAGRFQARMTEGQATADGVASLFITGAELSYTPAAGAPQTLDLRPRADVREGSVYNPVTQSWSGPGTHTEYVHEYLLIERGTLTLRIDAARIPAFGYFDAAGLAGTGGLTIPAATGTVTVTEDGSATTHRLRGEALTLEGTYDLRLRKDASDLQRTGLEGSGDFTAVRYGAVVATYAWAPVAAAIGLGAILAGVGAWLASNGKLLGGGAGLVAGYARVHGEEILQHPGRQEVYERVKAAPGVSFHQLCAQVSFGASTLTYHVRVLEKNGFITSLKDGRYLRFFDRHSGEYARERKNAVSTLRNPATAAIARHIREHPGVAQRDLAQRFMVTPSTVSWHVKRLSQVGLVQSQRDHPHTRYYAGEAWASLPASEQLVEAVA